MKTVLVIEDEPDLLKGLKENLGCEGYRVLGASTGERGVELAIEHRPSLVVLDIMLPGMDGFDVCRKLREMGSAVPIIILSARSDEVDRVVGLEIGADDYMTKPFSLRELLARIRARLRKRGDWSKYAPRSTRVGTVEVDFEKFVASRNGETFPLTPKEFEILHLLASQRGQVVSRDRILRDVFGYSDKASSRTVDTHVLNLRHKIEDDPANPRHIQTVYGQGYRLID